MMHSRSFVRMCMHPSHSIVQAFGIPSYCFCVVVMVDVAAHYSTGKGLPHCLAQMLRNAEPSTRNA